MTGVPLPDVPFEHAGAKWVLRLDHLAIAHFERHADMSFIKAMLHINDFVQGRELPRISIVGYVLWAGLSAHHPNMDLEQSMRFGIDLDVISALAKAFEAAMPDGGTEDPLAPAAKAPRKTKSKDSPKQNGTGLRN